MTDRNVKRFLCASATMPSAAFGLATNAGRLSNTPDRMLPAQPGGGTRGAASGGGDPGRPRGGAGREPAVGHRRGPLPPELARRITEAA